MIKNWLIRTKNNHILGPISKAKMVELYNNGSVKPDDEICSGNGYWFFIRESELVNRYLLGDDIQSFNPLTEANDVLTATGEAITQVEEGQTASTTIINLNEFNESGDESSEDETLLPADNDLEYPDIGEQESPSSVMQAPDEAEAISDSRANSRPNPSEPDLRHMNSDQEMDEGEALVPQEDDLSFPDEMLSDGDKTGEHDLDQIKQLENEVDQNQSDSIVSKYKKPAMIILALIGIIIAVVFYRKHLTKRFLSFNFVGNVHAQSVEISGTFQKKNL